MKRIALLAVLAASLAVGVPAANASSIGGVVQYAGGGYVGAGTSVYLEQCQFSPCQWIQKCSTTTDSNSLYNFYAPWGSYPCGTVGNLLTRVEIAKFIWPNGPTCRGWSTGFYINPGGTNAVNVHFSNC